MSTPVFHKLSNFPSDTREAIASQDKSGPDVLRGVLTQLFSECQRDEAFAAQPHYIAYKNADLEAFIKVDMSRFPLQIWYGDADNHKITNTLNKAIVQFSKEKCAGRQNALVLKDFYEEIKLEIIMKTQSGEPRHLYDPVAILVKRARPIFNQSSTAMFVNSSGEVDKIQNDEKMMLQVKQKR